MAQETEIPSFERKFGYSEIVWEIKNYFSARCKKSWSIESPVFSVRGNFTTKWRLCLKQCRIDKENILLACFQRLESHPSPEHVLVKWFLTFPCDGRDIYVSEGKKVFKTDRIICSPVTDIGIIEEKLLFASCYSLVIRCKMIVYNKDSEIYKITDNKGLKNLSQCMRVLYRMNCDPDLILLIGGDEIKAHKAVLCARNKNLRAKIEEDGDTIEYEELRHIPKGTATDFIGYLYTADLNYILRTPSFSMEDLIAFFEIGELQSYYLHDKMVLATNYQSNVFKFTWLLRDEGNTKDDCFKSPLWKLGKLTFQLVLFQKWHEDETKYISLYGEFGKDSEPDEAYLACAIETTDPPICTWKGQPWSRASKEKFGIEKFHYCKSLKDEAIFRHARIKCTLIIPVNSQPRQSIRICKVNSLVSSNKDQNYLQLSNDLVSLFETGKFSDLTIISNVLRFQAHKAILSCRSHILKDMLSNVKFRGHVLIKDLSPKVVRAFMRYIYSGIIQDYEVDDLMRLYNAANKFSMLSLKYTCSAVLQTNLNAENALETLVLSHLGKDLKLKYSAVKFIYLNLKHVYIRDEWQAFENAHPGTYKVLMQYLRMFIVKRSGIELPDDFTINDFIKHFLE